MAVHQVEEYYVFIQFKNELTDEQYKQVVNFLENERVIYDCAKSNLTIDDLEKDAAELIDASFSEEFSNLIK